MVRDILDVCEVLLGVSEKKNLGKEGHGAAHHASIPGGI